MRVLLPLLLFLSACANSREGYYAAAWSPDGKLLAIGTGHSLRLEDADTRELVREIATWSTVHAVTFTADGRQILYTGKGNTFTLLPVSGDVDPISHPEVNPVVGFAAAMSRDARMILSVSTNDELLVWRYPFTEPERRLTGGGDLWSYALTPDARYALSTAKSGEVSRWDVATGKRTGPTRAHDGYIFALAMSANGRYFVTGGSADDKTVAIWNPRTFHIERRIDFGTVVSALAISQDSRILAVGGNRKSIQLYDIATGEPTGTIDKLPAWPSDLAFSPDGKRLFVTFPRGLAKIYPRS